MHVTEEQYLDTAALTVDWDLQFEKVEQRVAESKKPKG